VRALFALARLGQAATVDQFAHAQAALATCLAHAELAAEAVDRAAGYVLGWLVAGVITRGLLPAHVFSPLKMSIEKCRLRNVDWKMRDKNA
jgi:hypothetical protein